MKKRTITIALLAALSVMTSARASEFDGGFVGAKIGDNHSNLSGVVTAGGPDIKKSSATYGIDTGYNWDWKSILVGVDAFLDSNSKVDGYSSNAYGVDMKLGLPNGNWLPYIRVGYAHTQDSGSPAPINDGGLHGAVGVEYKYTPNIGLHIELSDSSATTNGTKLENSSATVGLRYYFNSPVVAPAPAPAVVKEVPMPAPVAAPEPVAVVAPAPVPVVAPAPVAPQPKEIVKTILVDETVRLEGANFATSSAELLKTADAKLNEVVLAARKYPDVKLEVSGHTDNRGKKAFNQKLSENRALAVKAWLVKHGVAADRISTAGYADTQPIGNNKTIEGRASNRRVEVHYATKVAQKIRVTE